MGIRESHLIDFRLQVTWLPRFENLYVSTENAAKNCILQWQSHYSFLFIGQKRDKNINYLYLVSFDDSGTCLEEFLHYNGMAFVGCNNQCSVPIL